MRRQLKSRPLPPLVPPGARLDVSRIEHENVVAEVLANRRRFDHLVRDIRRLEADVSELKALVHALQLRLHTR